MIRALLVTLPLLATSAAAPLPVPPKHERGRAGAPCRVNETGPAALITLSGLKDRIGRLKVELYPANDRDFLAPDKALIAQGKAFKRIVQSVPAAATPTVCIRAPGPGTYALTVLHDRDGDGKFGFLRDGAGFSNNPKLRRAKPRAASVALPIQGVAQTTIVMNYRKGLGFGPLGRTRNT